MIRIFQVNIVLFSVLMLSCNHAEQPVKEAATEEEVSVPRGDTITFIMGDDASPDEVFYRNAEQYYLHRHQDESKVISGLYSLTEVAEYLIRHQDTSKPPWGQINLVSHGNPFSGLSARLKPYGERCNVLNMQEFLKNDTLPEFPQGLINEKTTIAIRSCGIGANKELLNMIRQFFSASHSPEIRASKYFEYFLMDDSAQQVKHFQADYWLINYKMGYRPSDRLIINEFNNLYPDAGIPWEKALAKDHASKVGDIFYYTFDVPGKWVFQYESSDSLPLLRTNREKTDWVKQNPEIMADLKVINMHPEDFNWWIRRIYIRSDENKQIPAFWVKGYSTVLCVLKLLPSGYEPEQEYLPCSPEQWVFTQILEHI